MTRLPAALALLAGIAALHPAQAGRRYHSAVAYCRAVGTIDAPDARYAGPAVPPWLGRALMRASGAPPTASAAAFSHAAWRCADGRVRACFYGANIPCAAKADTSRTPPEGAVAFCRAQGEADVVPNYVFGTPTVFAWACRGGAPVIARQVLEVDPQGYPAAFWYTVTPWQ